MSRSNVLWMAAYLAVMATLTWALYQARRETLASLSTEQARDDWQQWRRAAESDRGPVLRRVPESGEPPGLILLRDHFATSWLALAVLTSALFFALVFMIRGVISGPKYQPLQDDEAAIERSPQSREGEAPAEP